MPTRPVKQTRRIPSNLLEKPDEESVQVEQCTPGVDPICIAPDPDRRREERGYPLDSLRMVGTLEQEGEIWGVVMSSDANLYRVTIDNQDAGQNHGRVINIQEEGIELLEIVPNGTGGWRKVDQSCTG